MQMNDENPNYLFQLLAEIDDPQERARTRREWGLLDDDEAEKPQDRDKSGGFSAARGEWLASTVEVDFGTFEPRIPSVLQHDVSRKRMIALRTDEQLKR